MVKKRRQKESRFADKLYADDELGTSDGPVNKPLTFKEFTAQRSEQGGKNHKYANPAYEDSFDAYERKDQLSEDEKARRRQTAHNASLRLARKGKVLTENKPKKGEYQITNDKVIVGGKRPTTYHVPGMRPPEDPRTDGGNRLRDREGRKPRVVVAHPNEFTAEIKGNKMVVTFEGDYTHMVHFTSVPKPDTAELVRVGGGPDDNVITYTWDLGKIKKNRLMHALNGNISYVWFITSKERNRLQHAKNGNPTTFECKNCNRTFHVMGKKTGSKCMACGNKATVVSFKPTNKSPNQPKGGKAAGKQKAIAASVQRTAQEDQGDADAMVAKDAEKREQTTTTPEGHVIDIPDEGHVVDVPETEFEMPTTLFQQDRARSSINYWAVFMALSFLSLTLVMILVLDAYLTAGFTGLITLMIAPLCKKTLQYLRFELVHMDEPEKNADMRPDFMGHTKMKHQGRKARYRVSRTNECHTTRGARFVWLWNLADYVSGNSRPIETLVVDAEVFSQISPSVQFCPEQFAVNRIENSITRLATVNINRRSSTTILDNTMTLLKAYHWHHTEKKIENGYFSPYELTAPTRR